MAFDTSPALRNAPDCRVCPVGHCLARCASTAGAWSAMATQHPAQMPGGQPLIHAGEAPRALFTVRAGCIKSFTVDAEGNERVRGFYFPGDMVGLETLGASRAPASAAAVTPSQVCAASALEIQQRSTKDASLANRLLAQTRRELSMALAVGGEFTADQRVAAFLLYLRHRIGSGNTIRLPMTRREMGSYLRLATETVCRVLTRFEQKGWLTSNDKRIELHRVDALHDLAEPVGLVEYFEPVAVAA
ncbi:MAG TPA: Crp/Fnr family transcriptional regulator [Nevskiaceae bacterium]|nr:Crp/Fnr family transcriptional regulator [Nevskiaceae bacterium]